MHRSEIIRFRCCRSCPESRGVSQRYGAGPHPPSAPPPLPLPSKQRPPEGSFQPHPAPGEQNHPGEVGAAQPQCPKPLKAPGAQCRQWGSSRPLVAPLPTQPPPHQRVALPDFHQPLQDSCQVGVVRLHGPDRGDSWVRLLGARRKRWRDPKTPQHHNPGQLGPRTAPPREPGARGEFGGGEFWLPLWLLEHLGAEGDYRGLPGVLQATAEAAHTTSCGTDTMGGSQVWCPRAARGSAAVLRDPVRPQTPGTTEIPPGDPRSV